MRLKDTSATSFGIRPVSDDAAFAHLRAPMAGSGILSRVNATLFKFIPNAQFTEGKLMPGFKDEQHLPGANYLGPGTHLEERMRRGDRGTTDVDNAAITHDIVYASMRKNNGLSRAEKMAALRQSDVDLLNAAKNSKRRTILERAHADAVKKAFEAKLVADNLTGTVSFADLPEEPEPAAQQGEGAKRLVREALKMKRLQQIANGKTSKT